jgi:deoxyribonuclease V
MESDGRPGFGVCAAVDVHYLSTGGARAAAVLAADAAFAHVLAERTALVPRVPPYRPGRVLPA